MYRDKGRVRNGHGDALEADGGAEGLAVRDDGLAVGAVPAVEFDRAAALEQQPSIDVCRGVAGKLVAIHQVGVVRRRHPLGDGTTMGRRRGASHCARGAISAREHER